MPELLRARGLSRVSLVSAPDPVDLAPRWVARYACPKEHEFEVPLADDADAPATWDCRRHGTPSTLLTDRAEKPRTKPPRTHWGMVRGRRDDAELEQLLDERLATLRSAGVV